MEEALKVISEMKSKGIIKDYAIGGGIATLLYTEPLLAEILKKHGLENKLKRFAKSYYGK